MSNFYYDKALQFIKENDLNRFPVGKHVIEEDKLWMVIIDTELRPASNAQLEVHDEFLDIHIPLSGPESYGVCPRCMCSRPNGSIDKQNDILFFDDEIHNIITKKAGEMIVFDTNTAHAPLIGNGRIKKALFKIIKED